MATATLSALADYAELVRDILASLNVKRNAGV